VILPTGSRPNGRHLTETGRDTKVTSDTEEEAIDESGGTTRRQDDCQRACKSDPSTEVVSQWLKS
jgi:hypothetical protein